MTHRKNLLFVGSFPPQFGGISSHLATLVPDLVKGGYEVTVLSPGQGDSCAKDEGFLNIQFNAKAFFFRNFFSVSLLAIKKILWKKAFSFSDFTYACAVAKKIEDLSQEKSFDHIFFYTWKNGYCIPYLNSSIQDKSKLHMFMFGGLYEHPQKYLKLMPNIKMISDSCDSLFSSSKYCADSLYKILGIGNSVEVIYVGVDIEVYRPSLCGAAVREKFEIPSHSVLIVFFGRMNAEMGLDVILENIDEILRSHPDAYFLIAGAKNDLSGQAADVSHAHSRIKYWENVPQSEKPAVFSAADILLSPTKDLHACMGVSIKEAMACGKAVIGSSSGGIPEAIDEADETGFIAHITDGHVSAVEFQEKLRLLIEDGDLRDRVGKNARLRAEQIFSTTSVLEKYKKVFEAGA